MAIKETIPFNFDEIYSYIEDKFAERGYDNQEGSNTMQLVTAMSYLTSMLNANTATNINETLLTLARKRNTALQDARVLGYEIEHIRSYQYTLTLKFTNISDSAVTHYIEKYMSFTSGSKTYYYLDDGVSVTVPAGSEETPSVVTKSIVVIEGDLRKYENEPEVLSVVILDVYDEDTSTWGTQHYIDIPYTDVEDDGIEMFLTYYDEDGQLRDEEVWTRSKQFMIDADTVLNRNFVRLDDIEYKTPRCYFKIGDVGNEIRSGTIIQMNVLMSSGTAGAMIGIPTAPSNLDCEITNYALLVQGAEEESLESIKVNAPLFHNSANRVITKPDYIAFCNRQASVRYTDAWDGHDEYPHVPGHIWFSFVPSTTSRSLIDETRASPDDDYGEGLVWNLQDFGNNINWYIEDGSDDLEATWYGQGGEVLNIFNYLDEYKIPTLQFHHRHPVFMDFEYDIKIARYNIKTSKQEIHYNIFKIIDNFFRNDDKTDSTDTDEEAIEQFGSEYFQSSLIKRIDRELTDITGFDVKNLYTTIHLCEKNIVYEKYTEEKVLIPELKEIKIHLGIPFEGIFDSNGDVVFANLPSINTTNFANSEDLTVDESSLIVDDGATYLNVKVSTFNILLGTTVVGTYKIYKAFEDIIEVTLYVQDDNGHTSGIDYAELDTSGLAEGEIGGLFLNVQYPSSNIRFTRNTIPRLKKVSFL